MQGFGNLVAKIHALMIQYTSASQLTLEGFEHPFDQELDRANRWVILASLIPWDELASIYARELRTASGRLMNTSESWINSIFFVMNLITLLKVAAENCKNGLFLAFSTIYQCVMSDYNNTKLKISLLFNPQT